MLSRRVFLERASCGLLTVAGADTAVAQSTSLHVFYDPATLLTTGINDPRVAPWQPGKMAARLQAATTGGRPVLLRVDYDVGFGPGIPTTKRLALDTDRLAFLIDALRVAR